MKIIGVAGQMASGKSTVADYLVKKLPGDWVEGAFANAVKDIYCDAFNVDREFIEKWKRINEPPSGFDKSVRQSLQFIGDGFRGIKGDVWVEILFRKIYKNTIISDLRFTNEAKAIKKSGGLNILLHRPNFENNDPSPSEAEIKRVVEYAIDYCYDGEIKKSEVPNSLSNFDCFIVNKGSLEDLYKKLDNFLIPYIEEYFNE